MKIFLIGFMGSGKSAIGKLLSDKLQFQFYDTDTLVEKHLNQDIPGIFQTKGEKVFRQTEQEILQNILTETSNTVVSTGGGLPCFFENMEWMNAHGITIYLKRTTETLIDFLQHQRQNRPLLSGSADLKHTVNLLLEKREIFYTKSKMIVEIDGDESDEMVVKKIQILID